jgi:hypothetical protein
MILLAAAFGSTITALFVALVAAAAVQGFSLGASRIAALLGGLFAAAMLAVPVGRVLEGAVGGLLGTTGLTNRLLSVVVVAALVTAVTALALNLLIRRWLGRHQRVRPYDRPIGAALGLCEGGLMGLMLIWAVLSMEPVALLGVTASRAGPGAPPNPVAERVIEMSGSMRRSAVGRAADGLNPLKDLRLFTIFQKAIVVLNDPGAREAFVQHHAIAGLRGRPTVERAMAMLGEDAHVTSIIEGDEGITAAGLRALLDSPTVLRAFDETGIVEDLDPMADEIELALEQAVPPAP